MEPPPHISHVCKKCLIYLYVISKHKQALGSNLLKLLIDPRALHYSFSVFELFSPSLGGFFTSKPLKKATIKEDAEQGSSSL